MTGRIAVEVIGERTRSGVEKAYDPMSKLNFVGLAFAACLIASTAPHAMAAETLNAAMVNQAQVSPKSEAHKAPSALCCARRFCSIARISRRA